MSTWFIMAKNPDYLKAVAAFEISMLIGLEAGLTASETSNCQMGLTTPTWESLWSRWLSHMICLLPRDSGSWGQDAHRQHCCFSYEVPSSGSHPGLVLAYGLPTVLSSHRNACRMTWHHLTSTAAGGSPQFSKNFHCGGPKLSDVINFVSPEL